MRTGRRHNIFAGSGRMKQALNVTGNASRKPAEMAAGRLGLPVLPRFGAGDDFITSNLRAFESRFLFQPLASPVDPKNPLKSIEGSWLATRIEEVDFRAADGTRLNGWYVPPKNGKPVVVFAHGNGGHMGDRAFVIQEFVKRGFGFFAFDYRGYGKSEGTPSEAGLYQDMAAASEWLTRCKDTPPGRQIAMGESLGGAVAIETATKVPFRAVTVYSTFTSVPELVRHLQQSGKLGLLNFVPVALDELIRQRFESVKKLDQVTSPVLFVHATNDELVPHAMGERLYEAMPGLAKLMLDVEGGGHNGVFQANPNDFIDAVEELLKRHPA